MRHGIPQRCLHATTPQWLKWTSRHGSCSHTAPCSHWSLGVHISCSCDLDLDPMTFIYTNLTWPFLRCTRRANRPKLQWWEWIVIKKITVGYWWRNRTRFTSSSWSIIQFAHTFRESSHKNIYLITFTFYIYLNLYRKYTGYSVICLNFTIKQRQ